MDAKSGGAVTRRQFLCGGARMMAMTGIGVAVGALAGRANATNWVWQIDPSRCLQCGNCAIKCVMEQSAVKSVHAYAICGYCQLCTGFFAPEPNQLTTAAENQLCPTAAIRRTYVQDPYFQYAIDEQLCIGCAKCVEGCNRFGNGSLFLQIRHDRCLNCNECAIARTCPGDAIRRVPREHPYIIKSTTRG